MTRTIPSSRYYFCPIPSRHRLTDHGIFSIIAKTALGNSRRIMELQTPHFANRSESHTCKLPGGTKAPKFSPNVRMLSPPAIAPSIRRTRPHGRLNESSDQKSGARPRRHKHAATTLCQQQRKNYSAKANRKRPSQRFPFWTSRRTALYIKLLFGCRCLLHGFAHTTSGLAAVFAASGTFSGVNSSGAGSISSPRNTGAGCTCSPRNKCLNFRALGFCGANSTNEG